MNEKKTEKCLNAIHMAKASESRNQLANNVLAINSLFTVTEQRIEFEQEQTTIALGQQSSHSVY